MGLQLISLVPSLPMVFDRSSSTDVAAIFKRPSAGGAEMSKRALRKGLS